MPVRMSDDPHVGRRWGTATSSAAVAVPTVAEIGTAGTNQLPVDPGNGGVMTVVLPAGIASGDLIVIYMGFFGRDTSPSTPTGYTATSVVTNTSGFASCNLYCFTKMSAGSDSGATVTSTITSGLAGTAVARVFRGSGLVTNTVMDSDSLFDNPSVAGPFTRPSNTLGAAALVTTAYCTMGGNVTTTPVHTMSDGTGVPAAVMYSSGSLRLTVVRFTVLTAGATSSNPTANPTPPGNVASARTTNSWAI